MGYPVVTPERETLEQMLAGKSIARFGDGEIKLIMGGNCVSQTADIKIAAELLNVLRDENPNCLTGIPNIYTHTPKNWFWDKYKEDKYAALYSQNKHYFSSFVSRPDSAPWIDTPEYWSRVVDLWRGKRILLVTGGRSSALRPETMPEAKYVMEIPGAEVNSYGLIDWLEKEIDLVRSTFDSVILCLGPTATCLAWRLSLRSIHALDLGHIAVYYRRHLKGDPMDVRH